VDVRGFKDGGRSEPRYSGGCERTANRPSSDKP